MVLSILFYFCFFLSPFVLIIVVTCQLSCSLLHNNSLTGEVPPELAKIKGLGWM